MTSGRYQYTDDAILDMLRRCKKKHGKVTARVFDEDEEFCSASLAHKRFGSWQRAKDKAFPNSGRSRKYSDERLLNDLREVEKRDDKVTTENLQKHDDLVGPSVVMERFGKWSNAKEKAGIEVTDGRTRNGRDQQYTDEDILEALRGSYDRNDGTLTQRSFDDDDEAPSSALVWKRFGSFKSAMKQAGIPTNTKDREYTDEELIEYLQDCKKRYGKCTASLFASDGDFCSPETIQRRFGTWIKGKEKAGIVD